MNAATAAQETPVKEKKTAKKSKDSTPKLEKEMEGHPDYHRIKVVMTDGTEYETRSCCGKEGDVMRLDIDPKNHPAWHGGAVKVIEKQQLKKFEGRFGTFLSGDANAPVASSKKESADKEEKSAKKKS